MINVTVQVMNVAAAVTTDAPYQPDIADDLFRRAASAVVGIFNELGDDSEGVGLTILDPDLDLEAGDLGGDR